MCIKPMFAPILAGSFSRENALYGATISVEATCHPDPKRVTEIIIFGKILKVENAIFYVLD